MSEEIRVLSNREQARERINIWHGSSNNWINMIKELIGNSRDIFKKNNSTNNEIQIIIHNKNKIEFIDNASGIPVEGTASDGKPNYVAIFETPFAGSNYNNEAETVGQNGIFLFTLAMTSRDIEFFIARPNKNIYNISYHAGVIDKQLSILGSSENTYSRIIFELDEDVWENPDFTFDAISEIAKVQASKGNVKITVKDIQNNKYNSFYYENGFEDYFAEMTTQKSKVTKNISINTNKEFDTQIRGRKVLEKFSTNIIFAYSSDNEDDFKKELLNTADLTQFGTIQEGMINGLKSAVHKWLKDNGKYQKNEKNITYEDVFTGLNYVSDSSSLYVEYENQTKVKTSTERYKNIMKSIMEEFLEIFFIENKHQTEALCNQILINKRAREKSDSIRNDLKAKLSNNKKGLTPKIEGLYHCDFRHSTLEERMFIVDEGLSANDTITNSFDNRIMGAYGLKGRFINSLKATVKDVLNNEPALGIINGLGCGIEIPKEERKNFKDMKTFNEDDLLYGKFGILCDRDCWGSGISLSLITFVWRFMKPLLKQGRVYLGISPRYELELKNSTSIYAYNDKDKDAKILEIGESNIKAITIRKGLGEFNKDEFYELILSDEAREKAFIQIKYNDDLEEMIGQYFDILMGSNIEGRKKFIQDRILNVDLNELE